MTAVWITAIMLALPMGALAQIPGGAAEEPPPPVTADEVRSALQEIVAGPEDPAEPLTTGNVDIDPGALEILLEPLTQSEIQLEIDAWHGLLRAAVAELAEAEFELFEINAAEAEAAEAAEEAAETAAGDGAATEPEAEPEITPEHQALIDRIADLRDARTAIADRLRVVLDAFEAKGGAPETNLEVRDYIAAVGGVRVDTQNWRTAALTLREWAGAEDGGLRLVRNLGTVLVATLGGLVIGWFVGIVVGLALRQTDLSSRLMRSFLRKWIVRIGTAIGFLVGLSWIGTNMTPILAGIGAAGFILAFALQNTISNFASGLLILLLRPFDAGDEIEAGGTSGKVDQVSLFSTHLTTAENRKVIVPNNKIWDDVITN
jgi:small conductance mechanosensitive channel